MTEPQLINTHLRFSTEIVKRLGEELNPTLDKGILELVKNSYDADATDCHIQLLGTDQPGGKIVVEDNGRGMTADEIADGWLVLGRSSKAPTQRTALGRIPAGSKGLGRLAALRMGRTALLSTSSKQDGSNHQKLLIDWNEFDKATVVDDCILEIATTPRDRSLPSGTKVVIDHLKTGFGRMPVKRLARELVLLADPFIDDSKGFHPVLLAPEYKDLESLVRNRYFEEAEYHLHAEVSGTGEAFSQVSDWKGKLLYQAEGADIYRNGLYRCPTAKFDLWVFILSRENFSGRHSSISEVRRWLAEFGGVHFYYNGLRVRPYGGPGDDWLGMNLRRVRSPEERPGTNTSIGRITVFDEDHQLIEKTDRSGFIEDDAFQQLRTFARNSMDWMASRRLEEAERRRRHARIVALKGSTNAKRRMEAAIASTSREERKKLGRAFAAYKASRNREVDLLKKEVQLYRTLSTAGITAATFAHESTINPLKIISQSVTAIDRRAKEHSGERYGKKFKRPIDSIRRAMSSLSVLSVAILSLLDHEKRRTSRIDLHRLVKEVLRTYRPFFKGRDVQIVTSFASGDPFLRGQPASVESIITNLLNNSISAFEDAATQLRIIDISTEILGNRCSLAVSDSGPGITGIRKSDIWLPGRTTRKHGTGLGLTIVRDAVNDLSGQVRAIEKGPRGGAVITVHLPIIGA